MKLVRSNKFLLTVTLSVAVGLLLGILLLIQITQNEQQVNQTSAILLNRMESLVENNQAKQQLLVTSLKEDYTTRAKAVSYILDYSPQIETDVEELDKIAGLIKVDEIHLFDETGTIYSGTQPQYYGYSFDSGEQMDYFRPMLSDKTLSMCQDVTPNTAEGKLMMYAICWNEAGTRMLQVGIEPKRLTEELRMNGIQETMQAMPVYAGITMIVGNPATGQIEGSTLPALVGLDYAEIGIDFPLASASDGQVLDGVICGESSYYAVYACDECFVAVIQQKDIVHKDVPLILGLVALYLIIAVTVSVMLMRRMMAMANSEKINASTDYMTGFLNRRGYESHIQRYSQKPLPENFVYISMDLNGLKRTNDTYGHETGDLLIQAAASCMLACFGSYGQIFRTGGDEFVAMLVLDEEQLSQAQQNFDGMTQNWREANINGVSVSCGYVRSREFPDMPLTELSKIADTRMYQAKRDFYSASGRDRRTRNS